MWSFRKVIIQVLIGTLGLLCTNIHAFTSLKITPITKKKLIGLTEKDRRIFFKKHYIPGKRWIFSYDMVERIDVSTQEGIVLCRYKREDHEVILSIKDKKERVLLETRVSHHKDQDERCENNITSHEEKYIRVRSTNNKRKHLGISFHQIPKKLTAMKLVNPNSNQTKILFTSEQKKRILGKLLYTHVKGQIKLPFDLRTSWFTLKTYDKLKGKKALYKSQRMNPLKIEDVDLEGLELKKLWPENESLSNKGP